MKEESRINGLLDLATTRLANDRYADALALFRRALKASRPFPALHAEALRGIGDAERSRGRYASARPWLERAYRHCERTLGARHLQTLYALNSLGILCKYDGRFAQGRRYYLLALKRARGVKDREARDLEATLHHNIGGIDHSARRFKAGEPYARRSVLLRKRLYGASHPTVAADRAAYASILEELGRWRLAEREYRAVIAFYRRRRAGGAHRYDLAVNLNNLAAIHAARGKRGLARRLYLQTLQIYREILGPRHPDVGITLNNLGMLERDSGRIDAARAAMKQSVAVLRKCLGPRHPNLLACVDNLKSLEARPPRAKSK